MNTKPKQADTHQLLTDQIEHKQEFVTGDRCHQSGTPHGH